VLASSYHVADQVYTTVSVVQYPPFGTQFEQAGRAPAVVRGAPRLEAFDPNAPDYVPPPGRDWADQSDDNESEYSESGYTSSERTTPLYKIGRSKQLDDLILTEKLKERRSYKKDYWKPDLEKDQFFFVDGVTGSPYGSMDHRFVLFDLGETRDYKYAMNALEEIRIQLIDLHSDDWVSNRTFYWNIFSNPTRNREGKTMLDAWQEHWQGLIKRDADNFIEDKEYNDEPVDAFWHTNDPNNWKKILDEDRADMYIEQENAAYQENWHALQSQRKALGLKPPIKPARLAKGQIPLPARLRRGQAQPPQQDLAGLQARVGALEAQLRRQRQDDNTSCLLERVLERLELAD
jgi:hypothetical protein